MDDGFKISCTYLSCHEKEQLLSDSQHYQRLIATWEICFYKAFI